jgi:electron-transferring-flavoprotein dehydrogenase
MIVGDGAGLVDSLRLKGVHIAIQSGIAAGDALFECWRSSDFSLAALKAYPAHFHSMSGWQQMKRVRNVRAGFAYGMLQGMGVAGLSVLSAGSLPPGRLPVQSDWKHMDSKASTRPWRQVRKPNDTNKDLQLDRLSDLYFSGTKHEEHQPCHLRILDTQTCTTCIARYGAPCTLFCPANVYTLADDGRSIRIDPSNCLHCKTCQIKDPYQNIEWNLPEGGGGPHYTWM